MILFKKAFLFAALALSSTSLFAQEDLLSLVDDTKEDPHKPVYATFKTSRLGNAQTIETVKKKHLDFRISHRFDNIYNSDLPNPINSTGQTFIGFDNSTDIRFSFDYGITDDLTIGIGRSKMKHIVDGNIKWKLLKQTTDFHIPVSITFFSSTGYSHDPMSTIYGSDVVRNFKTSELHRFNFFNELVIACKATDWLSLEVLPAFMYRNYIRQDVNNKGQQDVNGFFTIGFGARVKLTKRMSLIGDYYFNCASFYRHNAAVSGNPGAYNPLSLGIEIETGGHVFSMLFTNASGLIENNFIPYTTDTWTKGQIKFGFCISRTFAL